MTMSIYLFTDTHFAHVCCREDSFIFLVLLAFICKNNCFTFALLLTGCNECEHVFSQTNTTGHGDAQEEGSGELTNRSRPQASPGQVPGPVEGSSGGRGGEDCIPGAGGV